MFRSRRRILWLGTAAYWVLIFVLTHLPPKHLPQVPIGDKLEHLLAFGMLGVLLSVALAATFPRRPSLILLSIPIGLLYALVDEQTQKLVGRSCELNDWIADATAICASVLLVAVIAWTVRRAHSRRSAVA